MPQLIRKRGKGLSGHKWVDPNFDIKTELREKNGDAMPETPAFSTSEFKGSDQWSEENLPDILFYFQPPVSQYKGQKVSPVLDENNNEVMSPHNPNKALRDIPTLPDRISVDVPGWMIEAWRRIDPRISLQDILDRMTSNLGDAQKLTDKTVAIPRKNPLQNRCSRGCRKLLKFYNETGRREFPHRHEVESVEELTMNNIRYNTTLEYHPEFDRLIKVKLIRSHKEGKPRIEQMEATLSNLEETTYPTNHFLLSENKTVPATANLSDSMSEAIELLWTLQERAIKHGLTPSQWKKLDRKCLPHTWFDRTKTKTVSNDTYDGGCSTCTWSSSEDDKWEEQGLKVKEESSAESETSESEVEEEEEGGVASGEDRESSGRKRDASEEIDSPAKRHQSGASASAPAAVPAPAPEHHETELGPVESPAFAPAASDFGDPELEEMRAWAQDLSSKAEQEEEASNGSESRQEPFDDLFEVYQLEREQE